MRKTIKYNIVLALSVGLCFLETGCKGLLEPEPVAQLTPEANYVNFVGAVQGINGVYAPLSGSNLYRGVSTSWMLQIDQMSDDVQDDPEATSPGYNKLDYFDFNDNNSTSYDLFNDFYTIIFRANSAIAQIPNVNIPTAIGTNPNGILYKDQFIGEAKFLRAFSYFNLTRLFGAVPLRTEVISSAAEVNIPRTPAAEVFAQIEADLTDAAAKLPSTYNNSGDGNESGRATKWSALACLADVYLYQKKYALAQSTAKLVIDNNGGKRLNNTYAANFVNGAGYSDNNQESLFEIQFFNEGQANGGGRGNTFNGLMERSSATGGPLARFKPTDNSNPYQNEPGFTGGLIQEYTTGDTRLTVNFQVKTNADGRQPWLTQKYIETGNVGNGNFPVYRMAEMYLIYAEATNELGTLDATGLDYINQLRRRAAGTALATPRTAPTFTTMLDITSGQTQGAYKDIIRSERRKELAMEGKRWFDLQRYGFAYTQDVLVNKQKRGRFSERYMLLPIARDENVRNPLMLPNNPGY